MSRAVSWVAACLFGAVFYVLVFFAVQAAFGQQPTETRIDLFDRNSNRTGHLIINRETGRLDSYDTKSNHTGTSTITPPPTQVRPGQNVYITPQPSTRRSTK